MSDPLVIGVLLASSFVLWINALVLHHRGRELTIGLAQEMAQHLGSMQKVIEDIAQIPEVLQDLNLGGVELRPPKSIVELGFEWFMNRNASEGVNSTPPLVESWSEPDQEPQNQPEGVENLL